MIKLRASVKPLDLSIIVAYLAAMAGIGFYFMRRNRNVDAYFKAGGHLPWWAVSLSIYATMCSSLTFMGSPGLMYAGNVTYAVLAFGIPALAYVTVKWYLPFFRRLNLTSAYEYLEVRFNLPCRLFASAAFILFMVVRTGVVAYLPALAVCAVTGLDVNVAIVAVTAITILYCTVGGVEAVIWSDVVQSVILFVSAVLILVWLVVGTDGGWGGVLSMGKSAGLFRVFDFAMDWTRPCFWVVLVGGLVANLASYTSDQCVVQRYMTTRNEQEAARSIVFNGWLSFFNCILFFAIGVALWTYYHSDVAGRILPEGTKPDAVIAVFIARELPVGISGLVLAAVAAATMSTLSANLNAAASAITTDFYRRLGAAGRRRRTEEGKIHCTTAPSDSDARLLLCGKVSTVVVGLLGGAMALWLANADIGNVYIQFQRFLGILTAGLGCLFFMGIFMKRVNGFGATCGLVANYVVSFALDQLDFAGKPHLLLYGFLGMVACLIVAPIASFLKGKTK